MQRSLDRMAGKLDGLEMFVVNHTAGGKAVDDEQFNTFAAGLHASSKWIRAFQIVSNGVITHTYPLPGNEAALGYNLLANPRPVIGGDVVRALKTGRVTITGPLPLVQGGLGIIIRKPLPRTDDEPARLVAIVMNIAPLLAGSGISEAGTNDVRLAIRRDTGEVFFGSPAVFEHLPITHLLPLPDGSWEMAAQSLTGNQAATRNPTTLFYLAGATIIFLVCLLVFLLARRQADLTETVAERTRELHNELAERKRAEQRVQYLNRVYAVLSDINQTIIREKDPQAMLAAACRIAVEKGQFRMAWIGLADSPTPHIKLVAHAGATADTLNIVNALLGSDPSRCECSFTLQALQTGTHAVCNDIAHDPQAESWREAALQRDYRAMASLPLKADDQVIGTFNLYAGELGFFDEAELRLLDELALDLSFALKVYEREQERVRAEEALRDSTRQLRALTALMETLREQERIRISREIHDELGQKLTGLKMDLYWLENRLEQIPDEKLRTTMEEKLITASATADETMVTVQRIAAELRPAMLDSLGLISTLRYEAKQFEARTGTPVILNLPTDPVSLDNTVATTTYRIFQEVLTNVARHAQATKVQAALEVTDGKLRLRVEDNGIGVSPEDLLNTRSLGLLGMTERAALLNGSVRVEGAPGQGTIVRLEIPIENKAPGDKQSGP
ncbi:MAG: GAF domain-containing protein [Akkermansiaceae bacterium]|nr:GAF domain-containing protein [Verrucomicrobiales bacterium]